jgi:hypothetical protein
LPLELADLTLAIDPAMQFEVPKHFTFDDRRIHNVMNGSARERKHTLQWPLRQNVLNVLPVAPKNASNTQAE